MSPCMSCATGSQMNHSAAFWREVALWLPDYAAQRAWLREHGPALLGRLPET